MKAEMVMGSSISCSLMELQARESKVESDQDSPPNFAIDHQGDCQQPWRAERQSKAIRQLARGSL